MGRELELKYRANAQQIAEIQEIYSGFTTISMETTYFDNPDKTFSELRWTLRRRMENHRSVCTLKTPLPDGSRGEWELECDDILAAIPKLCALGAPEELAVMAAPGLSPSCGARFTLHTFFFKPNGKDWVGQCNNFAFCFDNLLFYQSFFESANI